MPEPDRPWARPERGGYVPPDSPAPELDSRAEAYVGFPARLQPTFAHHLAHGTWPVAGVKELHLTLHATSAAPGLARQGARGFLSGTLTSTDLNDVLLMLTELVTNAVRHAILPAAGFVDVHVALAPERLRIEVRDGGRGFTVAEALSNPLSAGGYGLVILDRASSRWGVSGASPHCVWFELDREALAMNARPNERQQRG